MRLLKVNRGSVIIDEDVAPLPPPAADMNLLNEREDENGVDDTINSACAIGVVERVASAVIILRNVNAGGIHDEMKVRLTVPLFINTALAQQEEAAPAPPDNGPNVARPGSSALARNNPPARPVAPAYSEDEVIRKNVYYLASILRNFNHVLIQLIQNGVLRLEDKDQIIDENINKGDPVLKGLLLYSKLIRANAQQFGALSQILRNTGNEESADLLELVNIPPAAIRAAAAIATPPGVDAGSAAARRLRRRRSSVLVQLAFPNFANQTAQDIEEEEPGTWACLACTYRNNPALNVCEICEAPNNNRVDEAGQNGPPPAGIQQDRQRVCRFCTFLNMHIGATCDMCGHDL